MAIWLSKKFFVGAICLITNGFGLSLETEAKKRRLAFVRIGGMTGRMKNRKNNVLPFPKPPKEESGITTIIAQIGNRSKIFHQRRRPQQCGDLPRFSQPVIAEDFSTSANSFGVR